MGVRVVVKEGESLQSALRKLSRGVDFHYRRSWYKKRIGYYEKGSIRRRRKKRLQEYNRKLWAGTLRMYMGLKALHRREGMFPPS
jgi:ribosomal protein S21